MVYWRRTLERQRLYAYQQFRIVRNESWKLDSNLNYGKCEIQMRIQNTGRKINPTVIPIKPNHALFWGSTCQPSYMSAILDWKLLELQQLSDGHEHFFFSKIVSVCQNVCISCVLHPAFEVQSFVSMTWHLFNSQHFKLRIKCNDAWRCMESSRAAVNFGVLPILSASDFAEPAFSASLVSSNCLTPCTFTAFAFNRQGRYQWRQSHKCCRSMEVDY